MGILISLRDKGPGRWMKGLSPKIVPALAGMLVQPLASTSFWHIVYGEAWKNEEDLAGEAMCSDRRQSRISFANFTSYPGKGPLNTRLQKSNK